MKTLRNTKPEEPDKLLAMLGGRPPKKVNHARLRKLYGAWSDAEADRIAKFIEEACEVVHERS